MNDDQTNVRMKENEDFSEERTLSSRQRARSELTSEVEAYLASGGAICEIDPDVSADPPRKPQPKYGSRPI
jgi:SutA RNAP-binding domain